MLAEWYRYARWLFSLPTRTAMLLGTPRTYCARGRLSWFGGLKQSCTLSVLLRWIYAILSEVAKPSSRRLLRNQEYGIDVWSIKRRYRAVVFFKDGNMGTILCWGAHASLKSPVRRLLQKQQGLHDMCCVEAVACVHRTATETRRRLLCLRPP